MSTEDSVVAIYRQHTDADLAVKELQRGGVDMHKLSIVGKGYHTDEQAVGYYNTGDRMKYWGKMGALQYNGIGATLQTMIPLPGSVAICAGKQSNIPTGATTDERGYPNTNTTY